MSLLRLLRELGRFSSIGGEAQPTAAPPWLHSACLDGQGRFTFQCQALRRDALSCPLSEARWISELREFGYAGLAQRLTPLTIGAGVPCDGAARDKLTPKSCPTRAGRLKTATLRAMSSNSRPKKRHYVADDDQTRLGDRADADAGEGSRSRLYSPPPATQR